jgi:hypothetical protein
LSLAIQSTNAPQAISQRNYASLPARPAAEAAPRDQASLSGETGAVTGSVPSFEAAYSRVGSKKKETPLRDLPKRMPRTETLEQCKARRAKMLKHTEKFVDEMNDKWNRKYPTGIMKG